MRSNRRREATLFRTDGVVSSAKFSGLRSDHPVRSIKGGFAISCFDVADTPPFQGVECYAQRP